jgi:hypothetical protein
MFGIALLAGPGTLYAQRGGGGGGGGGAPGAGGGGGHNTMPVICLHDCPTPHGGLNSEDDLKNFRRSMAVQATPEQRAAFAKISEYTQAASDRLKTFRESLPKTPALADGEAALDEALARVRAGNQNFLSSFSDAQKSGLKEITAKLAKGDGELDKQLKALDLIMQTPAPDRAGLANSVASLDKELAGFQSEQLDLGKEMGILLDPESQGLAVGLPKITNSINIAGQTLAIPTSGVMSRSVAEDGHNVFGLRLVADLSDLQQNITRILRSAITREPRCGERIELQQATLTPLAPFSLVVANLHYERWVCTPGSASSSPMEVTSGDAEIEVKLMPSLQPSPSSPNPPPANASLRVDSEMSRVNAEGFLRNLLRSGDLGENLREEIAASLLSALQKISDLKATLPPAAEQSAILQKIQFQDAGADQLTFILEGQLRFSDEQAQQFAAQLKQPLTARGATAP